MRLIMVKLRLAVPLLLLALLPACSSNNPVPVTGIVRSAILVTVDPNPIPGAQNPVTLAVTVTYKITLAETAGLGCQVEFVSSSVFDPATGAQVAQNYFDGADMLVFVGSQRINPLGTLVVPQSLSYALPGNGKTANLVVTVQVKDDNGNIVNQSLLVQIQ